MFSHPRSNSMLMLDLYAARLGECLSLFFGHKKSCGESSGARMVEIMLWFT